eukprot:3637973-Alexandrium_andersonii.AAC.1
MASSVFRSSARLDSNNSAAALTELSLDMITTSAANSFLLPLAAAPGPAPIASAAPVQTSTVLGGAEEGRPDSPPLLTGSHGALFAGNWPPAPTPD